LLALVLASSFAQENGPRSLAELDKEAERAAAQIRAFLVETGGGSVMGAAYTAAYPLLYYWVEELTGSLAGSSSLTAPAGRAAVTVKTQGADYTLSAATLEIGNIIRIYTRLVRREDSTVAASWTTDLPKTPYLTETFLTAAEPGIPPDPWEPDVKEDPLLLELGGTGLYRSLHRGDEDWFLVTVPEGGYAVIETDGDTDTVMELYGENGMIAENDDGGGKDNARIGFMAAPGKSYVARVHGYEEDETGWYTIRAYLSGLPDKDMEPNDSMETAFTIPPGCTVQAFILSKDDEDWYKITLPAAGGYFSARTDGAGDTWLELLDSTGKRIAEDDDSGYGANGVNARISLILPGGTYYLKAGGYESGEYSLICVLREPNAEDGYENDDERENAKPIAVDEEQLRTFTTEDDVDWAVFTAAARGVYVITAKGRENGELDTYLSLYGEDGKLLTENDDNGAGYDALIRTRLSPGTYYIRAHVLEYPSGSYTLTVTRE
jgi:hypothetical protein